MATDWLLIDGSSLIFRAYYGVPRSVRAPGGELINAVRGFSETLARLVQTRAPSRVAIATDVDWRPAWRVALLPSYKEHRVAEPVPPELEPQMPLIESLMQALGVDMQGWRDHEAEDVIASWVEQLPDVRIEIASGDRDLFALVESTRVTVLYPERAGLAVIDEREVERRYGIPGRLYADFAVLRGDPSDGLPGLKGVGAVTAAQLLSKHGGVEGMIRDGVVSELQRTYLSNALQVVHPVRSLPVPVPPGRRDAYPADQVAVDALTERYGLRTPVQHLLDALNERLGDGVRGG
jgi:5'-3' exonuclease